MEILEKENLKLTKTRKCIIELLKKEYPLSAEQMGLKLQKDDVKLSSIYRNLRTLEDKGIIIKIVGIDGLNAYQLNDAKHKHRLICSNCYTKITIDSCPANEIIDELEKKTGFKINAHSFEFQGLCEECRK